MCYILTLFLNSDILPGSEITDSGAIPFRRYERTFRFHGQAPVVILAMEGTP
jgi:hypothetical protein